MAYNTSAADLADCCFGASLLAHNLAVSSDASSLVVAEDWICCCAHGGQADEDIRDSGQATQTPSVVGLARPYTDRYFDPAALASSFVQAAHSSSVVVLQAPVDKAPSDHEDQES